MGQNLVIAACIKVLQRVKHDEFPDDMLTVWLTHILASPVFSLTVLLECAAGNSYDVIRKLHNNNAVL